MKTVGLLLASSFLIATGAHGEDFFIWKNIHGQSITAALVAANPDYVYLKKESDGKIYRVQTNQFDDKVLETMEKLQAPAATPPDFEGKAEMVASAKTKNEQIERQNQANAYAARVYALKRQQAQYQAWLSQWPTAVQQAIVHADRLEAQGDRAGAEAYFSNFMAQYQEAERQRIYHQQQAQLQMEQIQAQQELINQLNQMNWNLQQLYR